MTINCDDCGKEANFAEMPKGQKWFTWMSNSARPDECIVCLPCDDGVISCVCFRCMQNSLNAMAETVGASIPVAIEKSL